MTQPGLSEPAPSLLETLLDALEAGTSLLEMMTRLLGEEQVTHLLEINEVRILAFVLDTNVILPDLQTYYYKSRLTPIMQLARFGVRFYASTEVRAEVPEKLHKFFREADIPAARQMWEQQYAPGIMFLDPTEVQTPSPRLQRLANIDHGDDLGTGQLVELIRPSLLLSEDRHLRAFGRVKHDDWPVLIEAYCTIAQRDTAMLGVNVGGAIIMVSLGSLLHMLFGLLAKFIMLGKQLPAWFWVVLLGVVGLALAFPASRHWLTEQMQGLWASMRHIAPPVGRTVKTVLDAMVTHEERARQARAILAAYDAPEQDYLDTDLGYIVYVLSTAPARLTPTDLVERMMEVGYAPRTPHPAIAIGRVLHKYPTLFLEEPKRYWRLKPAAEPANALGTAPAPGSG